MTLLNKYGEVRYSGSGHNHCAYTIISYYLVRSMRSSSYTRVRCFSFVITALQAEWNDIRRPTKVFTLKVFTPEVQNL